MALNTVTLKWDVSSLIQAGQTGTLTITPNVPLTDSTDHLVVAQQPVQVSFQGGIGQLAGVVANDNGIITPTGSAYVISITGPAGQVLVAPFTAQINFANGAIQWVDQLTPIVTAPISAGYVIPALPLPLASGGTGVAAGSNAALLTALGAGLPAPVARRPAWRAATTFSQIFQTGHNWSATGSGVGSSNLNDSSTFVKGTQCASITTAGNGLQANFRSPTFGAVSMAGAMLRLTFKVDNVTNLSQILFYVGSSGLVNYFNWTVHTHANPATTQNYVQSGEWVSVTVPWANVQTAAGAYTISASGVPSTETGFTGMEFAVFDNGSGPVTVHLQAVEIVPDTVTTFPNGVVSIVFDDSYGDVWTYARPVMDTYGYRGTLYTIASSIGVGGSLTLSQLQQMQDISGWEVGGHAYTLAAHNAGYPTLTAAQVNDEMRYLRAWLLANGFSGDSFAYPLGMFSSTTDNVPIDQIAHSYFSNARSIISELAETFPPPMPYRVRSKTGISSAGTTVSTITAAGGPLDRCQLDGSWYVITLHDVIAGSPTLNTQISQSDFSTLMAAINTRGIPVLPVGDAIKNYS